MNQILILLIVVVICWAAWAARRIDRNAEAKGGRRYDREERARQPAEVASGQLVLSEVKLRSELPAPFVVRVDQVYRTHSNTLVLVETKTRPQPRAYQADIIELSVQAAVLRHAPPPELSGVRVEPYAYVRCGPLGRQATYIRVDLLGDADLLALRSRRDALLSGEVEPCRPASKGVCRKCAFRAECYPRAA